MAPSESHLGQGWKQEHTSEIITFGIPVKFVESWLWQGDLRQNVVAEKHLRVNPHRSLLLILGPLLPLCCRHSSVLRGDPAQSPQE